MRNPLHSFSVHLWPSSGAAVDSEMQCALMAIMELNIQELPSVYNRDRVQAFAVIIELNVQEFPNSAQACRHGIRVVMLAYRVAPVLSFWVAMD